MIVSANDHFMSNTNFTKAIFIMPTYTGYTILEEDFFSLILFCIKLCIFAYKIALFFSRKLHTSLEHRKLLENTNCSYGTVYTWGD